MKKYYSLLRHLKKKFNFKYKISVRRVYLPDGLDGLVQATKEKLVVKINKSLPETVAIDTLIHEISHCLCWDEEKGHGEKWGIAYSKVYREYLIWLEENNYGIKDVAKLSGL